ncbi:hypothetical protein VTK73DRAFT_4176 [Phialemonium thermophilum]|uniref:Uncharacterized protein n=1 Tax=Phialemonium thermophilum TaxID=223376 RepID=A0ABR3XZG3_9PEZI
MDGVPLRVSISVERRKVENICGFKALPGWSSLRRDRESIGGRCETPINVYVKTPEFVGLLRISWSMYGMLMIRVVDPSTSAGY